MITDMQVYELHHAATHRDFLGALLANISRAKVGDIIVVGDRGAQAIVKADVSDSIGAMLTKVRSVPVTVKRIDWDAIQVRPPKQKQINTVEASMRLDAVGSSGFSMSRSKLADIVKSGGVFVNYKEVTSPAKVLKTGDVVTLRGKGRIEIGECSLTSKGRYRVELVRYM